MQQLKIYRLLLILFVVTTGCKGNSSMEIINDRSFDNGIHLRGNSSSYPEPIATIFPWSGTRWEIPAREKTKPEWAIAQWGSNHVMKDIAPRIAGDTTFYQNEAKRMYFIKNKETKNTLIGLEVFASKEYPAPREDGEDWVHLLLERNFTEAPFLKDVEKLTYAIKSRLLFCENKTGEEYTPGLHTAQVTLFLTIQNRNEQSTAYGDFFWFGLPLYDYRYEDIPEYAAQDLGKEDATRKFIYTVAASQIFDTSMHHFGWITVQEDIYPFIKNAFETCKKNGYMDGSHFNDLAISSMNVGWEVPGTFDCGILFECPSLTAVM